MENEKTKTAGYQSIEKLNLAKNLDKFAIFKLRNKHSAYPKGGVSCSADTFSANAGQVMVNQILFLRINPAHTGWYTVHTGRQLLVAANHQTA